MFPLIDPILGKVGDYFAARWEQKNRRNLVRWFDPGDYQRADVVAFAAPDWTRVSGGTALLFIHGTTAQSNTAFDQLPAETLTELGRRYHGRVFALDHFTISVTPHDNVKWLAEQLTALGGGSPLTLDIVSHSRGGLVGRVLAERAADVGLSGKVTVRNFVMVASPNAGTALADKAHLSQLMDRVTDLAQFIPDAGVTDVVGLVLSILKQLTVGAFGGLEGIMSMDPQGEYLKAFNNTAGSTATYRAIGSNYQPARGASLARIARNAGTDFVFQKASNDLVVPTNGAYEVDGVTGFPIADPLVFPAEAGVDHASYFTRPEVSAKLLEWLPGVRCRVASRLDRPDSSPAWASTKARTQSGATRAWSRSAHPIALRMKKSRSARFGSMASVSRSWSSRSLRPTWLMIAVRRSHRCSSTAHSRSRSPSTSGAPSRTSRTRCVATSSTTSHHAPGHDEVPPERHADSLSSQGR